MANSCDMTTESWETFKIIVKSRHEILKSHVESIFIINRYFFYSTLSLPLFIFLKCLESCVNDENPKQYEDMTAGEFLTERLIELGLKKT